MREVAPGDLVFSFVDTCILAVGIAQSGQLLIIEPVTEVVPMTRHSRAAFPVPGGTNLSQASELAARFHCLADFEPAARERLPHAVYEFVAGAAGDELTLNDNKAAFDRLKLRPRVLRDVSTIATSVTLFGDTLVHPILLAPTSFQRMTHPEGEVATARGAGEARAIFVLSTTGTASIEECVAASAGSCRGVGGNWLRRRRFRLPRPRRSPCRDGSYVGRTRIAIAFRGQRVVRPS